MAVGGRGRERAILGRDIQGAGNTTRALQTTESGRVLHAVAGFDTPGRRAARGGGRGGVGSSLVCEWKLTFLGISVW